MSDKKADIIAVARAAKVSPSTVSRSFNHPDLVKPATRKKIDMAVKRLGYIRNRAAQTIHGIRSGTIGLIVPTIDHAIFAELIQSFSDAVDAHGFTILLASHGYDLDREYALARKMLEHRVDGLALVGLEHASETFRLVEQQNVASILLWNHAQAAALPCVGADNHEAGRLIAGHIATLGHTEVACMFPPLTGNDRAAHRFEGAVQELSRHGILIPPHWNLETPYSIAAAKAAALQMLDQMPRPDVVLCGNDVLAWGVLQAAARLGLKVPSQLAVTGIGDFKGSKEFEPPLTTVKIPAHQIGSTAGDAIAAAIVQGNGLAGAHHIPLKLMARATT
ncbi:MAG: LacI family DNA-binding transcriptional regulator [Paracoccaceae bacterium]